MGFLPFPAPENSSSLFSLPNYGWARVPFLGAPCALAVEGAVHPFVYNLLVVLIAVGWVGVLVELVEMLCLGTRVACVKFEPQVTTMQISVLLWSKAMSWQLAFNAYPVMLSME